MRESIESAISGVVKELFDVDVRPELTRPDEQFGDYATNVALQLAGKLNKKPREIADKIADNLRTNSNKSIREISVEEPGFLNIRLNDDVLWQSLGSRPAQSLAGKSVVAEYSDPNPFKVLHAGHLYTSIVGDAIANLLAAAGGDVHRVTFGGDVGLHVGKTMWAILKRLGGDENPAPLKDIPAGKHAEWMAGAYVEGTTAYENDERAQGEIIELNKRIYQIHAENDQDSPLAHIYWTCRQWSYDYFDDFYKRIGSSFERYYRESETAIVGLETVNAHIGEVFEKSEGAVIFRGEKYGLFTQVFINSQGLPTYSAKDVGLIMAKWRDYHFDHSIVITGNEQQQYMAVVLKAVEQFAPALAGGTTHLTHGLVKLRGGEKMSSRKGNILAASDVLDAAVAANKAVNGQEDEETALSAVKYAFLKQRLGGDIIYDPAESVALEGNSGPYLQYAHARARSILAKSKVPSPKSKAQDSELSTLDPHERSLLRKISEYTESVEKAIDDLVPHQVATYLYELAQVFNRFYENNRVVGDKREAVRLKLVKAYADTLKSGLELLNISAPERM